MNRKQLLAFGIFIAVIITLNSCDDSSEEADPCLNGPEISVDNVMISIKGKSTGEIVLSATGGSSPHMFSIDGTNFQSNGTFSNIPADDYTVVVKDANDCTVSEMV